MLPLAEFAYNNSYTTATKTTPFYANYGFHPKTMWPTEFATKNPASSVYGHWLKSVHTKIPDTLEEKKFEVERIIRSEVRETWKRVRGRARITKKLYYLVKWVGYPDDECTWEPGEHLTHAFEYIEDFHRENPEAPKL